MLFSRQARHDINQFSYHKDTKTFTAEDSELDGSIWCDEIFIKNPKTGNEREFIREKDDLRDGELMGRRYSSGDLNLLIIND